MHLIVCMSFFEAGPATRVAVQLAQVALVQPATPFASSLPLSIHPATLCIHPATLRFAPSLQNLRTQPASPVCACRWR